MLNRVRTSSQTAKGGAIQCWGILYIPIVTCSIWEPAETLSWHPALDTCRTLLISPNFQSSQKLWLALLPEQWTTHNTAFWILFPQTDRLSPCPIPPSQLSRTKSALSIIRLENLIEHEIKSSWWPPPSAFTFHTQFFYALLNALETSRSYLLCVLTIPAFTRLSVHHYLPAPPTSGGSHSAPAIKASSSATPLHLFPFTPHCLVPAGGSLSFWPSQSFHFICENHFVLFSHFVLGMAPLTVCNFILSPACSLSDLSSFFFLKNVISLVFHSYFFAFDFYLPFTQENFKIAIILAEVIFLPPTFLTVVINSILLINTLCSFHSIGLLTTLYIVHDGVFSDSPVQHSCLDFFMLLWLLLSSLFAGANDITNFLNARLHSHSVFPQWVCSFLCHQRGNRCCYVPHLHV